jgi:hypothetical protein
VILIDHYPSALTTEQTPPEPMGMAARTYGIHAEQRTTQAFGAR